MAPSKKIQRKCQEIEEKKFQESKLKDTNPFELRHNKIKHKVLGRKIAKNEFGMPLINRNRAFKRREQTLLKEYRNKHKSGQGLKDIREKDSEQRLINKYREEQNQIDLNQNDTVKLTHKGKPLEELIDDNISDDDDIDLFNRDDYVETTHFGGGELGPPRNKKEVLKEILAEKLQVKFQKEETALLTEKLDNEWNEVKNLIRQKDSNQMDGHNSIKHNPDDYDSLLKQLTFEDQNLVKEKKANSIQATFKSISSRDDERCLSQIPDDLFKTKLNSIDFSNDIVQIVKTIKEIIDLLSKVTRKSYFILRQCITNLAMTNLKFTPKEIAILIIGAYFKELQLIIHLILLRTLNKIKYLTLNEVAWAIFLNNFFLKTMPAEKFHPELFIHIDNLICLCLPQDKTKIKLFHRMDYEVNCILNVSKLNDTSNESSNYLPTLINLFSDFFKNFDNRDENVIAYNMAFQIFKLFSNLYDKYSSLSTIRFMLSSTMNKISHLIQAEKIPDEMKNFLNNLVTKIDRNSSKSIIINMIQSKPFILPMLEPQFDQDLRFRPKICERKRLVKKYKREFKGAQREIRKDSKFLQNTYLNEMEKKDRIRNKKVKEILRDLSIQQGLYKKKK